MISNASCTASSNARDFSKKKKKKKNVGLRREQWLSQVAVTNKEERREKPDHRDNSVENVDDNNSGNLHYERFMQSPSSSSMGGTDVSTNFSGSSTSSSSSSEEDHGCVDDWEVLADALDAKEEEEEKEKLLHESVKKQENVAQSGGSISESNRAWRPDDNHRPRVLPNMAKQLSFPELDKRFSTVSIPSSCPICYQDLDMTDSSFFPCPCGFRLCLFCHKTIFDGDGRCPGCRMPYERDVITTETSFQGGCVTVRLIRSSSMFCRS